MGTAVVFGAGNVGRGLLGEVFCDAGLEVVFVDVDDELIAVLNSERGYLHVTVDNQSRRERLIAPVRAVRADDASAVAAELLGATLAACCVGARALPAVCRAIAPALVARLQAGRPPLNLLIAENLHGAVPKIRGWLREGAAELDDDMLDGVGLVATSIGRMIPAPDQARRARGPGVIEVEPYRFLPIDAAAIRGDLPVLPGVVADPGVDFDYYSDRKLFLHNMGHAVCAYLGLLVGDTFVWQTIARPGARALVRAAMVESAGGLAERYRRPIGALLDHIDDLLHRFANRALGDTNERVARDPRRKLAADDRFAGVIALCRRAGIVPRHIGVGLAAGVELLAAGEGLSRAQVDDYLAGEGILPQEREMVDRYRTAMAAGLDFDAVIEAIGAEFDQSRIP